MFLELGYNLSVPMEDYEIMSRDIARKNNLKWGEISSPMGSIRLTGDLENLKLWLRFSRYCEEYGQFSKEMYDDCISLIQPDKE